VLAFPVSVEGVAIQDGRVLLLENERAEWELPAGSWSWAKSWPTA
jgi:hypothetical protein